MDKVLTARIKAYARGVGFDAVGVARAEAMPDDREIIQERIAAGHFEGLPWFTAERAAFSSDPRNLLPTARSVISLAMSYRPGDEGVALPDTPGVPRGRVSAYAWGRDYHSVLKERMETVVAFIRAECGAGQQARTLVDTARIVDRAVARRAGVGWVGKHTNLITKEAGSWVFLGEILTELDLVPDLPLRTNCGSCDLCLRVCPTGAIVAPYTVDSNLCISYLTIEHRGSIPRALRPAIGNWIFGCDLCQEVCPPNFKTGAPAHPEFRPGMVHLSVIADTASGTSAGPTHHPAGGPTPHDTSSPAHGLAVEDAAVDVGDLAGAPALLPLLRITPAEFAARFGTSPIKRAKREGLQRNVAVALGNSGDRAAVPALVDALSCHQVAPLVRAHVAWALGRLGGDEAMTALHAALDGEDDTEVRAEIRLALDDLRGMQCPG